LNRIVKKLKEIFKFPPPPKEFIFTCECGEEFDGVFVEMAIKHEIVKKHRLVSKKLKTEYMIS